MMVKQAEIHRETLEKEFSSGLERIRAEHEKAITEQQKFREEYTRSCPPLGNGDNTLMGVRDNQGNNIMTFQMNILQRKAIRAEQEIKDIKEKHERELRHERDLNIQKEKIIDQERQKVEGLKEELRMYEESVLKGLMPGESKEIMEQSRNESPDPVAPKHKKIKISDEESKDNVESGISSSEDKIGIKKEAPHGDDKELKMVPIFFDENNKVHYEESMSTAYTISERDKSNILIVKKDPKAISSEADAIRLASKPKVLGAHLIRYKPRLPTEEEVLLVLSKWRAMLRSTGDYYPDKKKTPEEYLFDLKVLMGAKGSFNKNVDMNPIARQQWKHREYGPIHRQYFIPLEYMAPDAFFEQFKETDNNQMVYYKRICSVVDYYEMLSRDNPQYRPKEPRVPRSNPNPRDYRPHIKKNIAYNPYASSDKAPSGKWGQGLMSSTPSTMHNAWSKQGNGLMGETSNVPEIRTAPSSAPTIRSPTAIRAPVISKLSADQQHASERTHRHRTDVTRSNIPIPNSDNDSSQEDSDSLFDDQLLPPEKSKILRLRTEIRRIRGGQTYPSGYENDRARAIKSADALRLAGKPIPTYLENLEPPWVGMGKAYRCYDDNEISIRQDKIDKIKRLNAEHCQLEHIANMPSIERKGGPGGQVRS
jgi:hypothetical protein